MTNTNGTTDKATQIKLMLLGGLVLAGAIAFGVHTHNKHKAEAEKQAAVVAFMKGDPFLQMLSERHKASRKFMYYYLSKGMDSGGEEGMQGQLHMLQMMLGHYYLIDYNWYAKADVIQAALSYEYAALNAITKEDAAGGKPTKASQRAQHKKEGYCAHFLQGKVQYGTLVKLTDKQTADNYSDSIRYLVLSAQDKQIAAVWPGIPQYAAALQMAKTDLAAALSRFAPGSEAELAELAFGSQTKMKCNEAKIILYAMMSLPPAEMALIWRRQIEADAETIKEARKKRGME
ncbi:MAG: hypothetical protein GC185_11350 [Alphaproteobacteria bacterium]|nr:hypothetical protein [Alphaproteobacteria bacterium]